MEFMEINNWLNNLRLGAKNSTALVVHGPRGSGKSVAIKTVERLTRLNVPARYVTIGDFGGMFFLDSIYKTPMLVVEVATGDYTGEMLREHLKPLISERQLRVDRQGKSTITVNNNMNIILHADEHFQRARDENDRRFLLVEPLQLINAANEVFW